MPYINKIVDYINTSLQGGTLARKAFQQGKFYSLAKQITVQGTEEDTLRPFVYELNGRKEIDPFINDVYPFQMYHRCNGQTYSFKNGQAFGDGVSIITETSSMIAVIFGDPEKLSITQEDLAFLIVAGLPTNVGSIDTGNTSLGQIEIKAGTINHNSLQVFTAEYGTGVYPLKPQSIYFSLSYTIETNSDKGCLACEEC